MADEGEAIQSIKEEHRVQASNRDITKNLGVFHMSVNLGYPDEVKTMVKSSEVTDYTMSPNRQLIIEGCLKSLSGDSIYEGDKLLPY